MNSGSMTLGHPRSFRQRIADFLVTYFQKLPPQTNSYTVASNLSIPMRDGIELLADVWTPTGPIKGTLLTRSPYGWDIFLAAVMCGVYASRGYRVVLARCRGTFGSGGKFEPMVNEVNDGADTVAWMRKQPWFDGQFATFGGSYLSFTQWALLMDPPPEMVAAVVSVSMHDFQRALYPGGAFCLSDFLGWSHQNGNPVHAGLDRIIRGVTGPKKVASTAAELPLLNKGESLLDGVAPWYKDWVSRRDPNDPYWSRMKLGEALEKVNIPVLIQSGWQDLFLPQTIEQYDRLRSRGIDVSLTMGPWTHTEPQFKAADLLFPETVDFLDAHLSGHVSTRPDKVHINVTGSDEWQYLPFWPPETRELVLYPRSDNTLAKTNGEQAQVRFRYDPKDPTPTIGGPMLEEGGYKDDSALALRDDVVIFDSQPLDVGLTIMGKPIIELAHETDNPHVDLFVRISEVDSDGKSCNVSDGFVRLDPANSNGLIQLKLDDVAHNFAAGKRIRLLIAGGCHPRWERNLGTGLDPATSSEMECSNRTIDLERTRLLLPEKA